MVHHDGPDRGIIVDPAARPQHRVGGQCSCAGWSGGSAGVDNTSGQPLGLAVSFFCCRYPGFAGWFLDLEVREGAFRQRRDGTPKTGSRRLLFYSALSEHLVMLSRRDRFHVVVVRLERIRAALHHGSGA